MRFSVRPAMQWIRIRSLNRIVDRPTHRHHSFRTATTIDRRRITESISVTCARKTSAPHRHCRYTCARTPAIAHSVATSARRRSQPRAIWRSVLCSISHTFKSFRKHKKIIKKKTNIQNISVRCITSSFIFLLHTTNPPIQVHMETHMWKNSLPRRGKKMSIEFGNPFPIAMNARDAELLKHRPDLFYPYMSSAAYLNGMQHKVGSFYGNRLFSNEP